jgi:hypothetical protein
MYGISRFDYETNRTHGWRVSLRRHGRMLVKNFTDKRHNGSQSALKSAQKYRDQLLAKYPPITRREVCVIRRSNNKSGITGVCTYGKRYRLKDGTERESRYWEANWPDINGKPVSINFSVNKYGEEVARSMAIRARRRALKDLEGPFWASERGVDKHVHDEQIDLEFQRQHTRVA